MYSLTKAVHPSLVCSAHELNHQHKTLNHQHKIHDTCHTQTNIQIFKKICVHACVSIHIYIHPLTKATHPSSVCGAHELHHQYEIHDNARTAANAAHEPEKHICTVVSRQY